MSKKSLVITVSTVLETMTCSTAFIVLVVEVNKFR